VDRRPLRLFHQQLAVVVGGSPFLLKEKKEKERATPVKRWPRVLGEIDE
jgi:hypothetical protein